MKNRKCKNIFYWIFSFLFFSCLLAIDVVSKYFTYRYIPKMSWFYPTYPFGGMKVFKDFFGINFSINHVQNSGAAWGVFSNFSTILFYLRIALIVSLVAYLCFFNKNKKQILPLLFILTGALGNILDMFIYGNVVDMLHFTFQEWSFPVFNFADIMISTGIFLLFVLSFSAKRKKRRKYAN